MTAHTANQPHAEQGAGDAREGREDVMRSPSITPCPLSA